MLYALFSLYLYLSFLSQHSFLYSYYQIQHSLFALYFPYYIYIYHISLVYLFFFFFFLFFFIFIYTHIPLFTHEIQNFNTLFKSINAAITHTLYHSFYSLYICSHAIPFPILINFLLNYYQKTQYTTKHHSLIY